MVDSPRSASTIDQSEVDRFSAMADEWWSETGKFRALHRFNPTRLAYVRDQVCGHFGRDPRSLRSLEGLRILDIGCGGGLLSEPLSRLGAEVVGADASATNIEVARIHAARSELPISYRATTAEALADAGETFDVVLAMEVIEHVANVPLFTEACARMVRPGGLLFVATLSRTLRSFALAIVGAEYILGWLPRGTHNWEKFITPEELRRGIAQTGLRPGPETGVVYNPLTDRWSLSRDMGVNYIVTASRQPVGETSKLDALIET